VTSIYKYQLVWKSESMRPNYVIEDPRDKMNISFLRQVNKEAREEDERFYNTYMQPTAKRKSYILAHLETQPDTKTHVYKGKQAT